MHHCSACARVGNSEAPLDRQHPHDSTGNRDHRQPLDEVLWVEGLLPRDDETLERTEVKPVERLEATIIAGLPGAEDSHSRQGIAAVIARYRDLAPDLPIRVVVTPAQAERYADLFRVLLRSPAAVTLVQPLIDFGLAEGRVGRY